MNIKIDSDPTRTPSSASTLTRRARFQHTNTLHRKRVCKATPNAWLRYYFTLIPYITGNESNEAKGAHRQSQALVTHRALHALEARAFVAPYSSQLTISSLHSMYKSHHSSVQSTFVVLEAPLMEQSTSQRVCVTSCDLLPTYSEELPSGFYDFLSINDGDERQLWNVRHRLAFIRQMKKTI